jgi:dihydroorotate dehydrogenase (fumarate)
MGLSLKSPVIAGSSGLTNSVKQIKQLEGAGVGAVVLKSLFEEQINREIDKVISSSEDNSSYPEAEDYIRNYTRINSVQKYLGFITEVKESVSIPVIASINCISSTDWVDFAKDIANAGADALELNIYELPHDKNLSSENCEKKYIDILVAVKKRVTIPVSVKISPYFTNLVRLVDQLYAHGAAAVVLFNRFYEPDFNLETLEFTSSEVMSSPGDLNRCLRWTGIIKGQFPRVEIAASTGIHAGDAVIKQLLAGAQVTQVCSTLYLKGFEEVAEMEKELKTFMLKWNFKRLDDFRGRMSYANIQSPEVYERAQFMKYFSNR